MKDRTNKTIKAARHHLADWLNYCHRLGFAKRGTICTSCAYDAIADAIEATQRQERRRRRA